MEAEARLLGRFRVQGEALPADKRSFLLAYAAYHGDWLSRDQVAFLFWPDTDEQSARRNLRQLLSRIKTLPAAAGLEIEPGRLRWHAGSDVGRFRLAVGRQEWEQAVALYGGELLSGFNPYDAAGFSEWLELERENLRSAFRRACLALASEHESKAKHEEATRVLGPLLGEDELAEDVLQAYLRNAYLSGQRDAALTAYTRFEERLRSDLGLQPLEETQELAAVIRAARTLDVAPVRARRRSPIPLSVQRPPVVVGRESLSREVLASAAPFVLLRGEAGVGKSRLLAELAPGVPVIRCLEGLQSVPFQPVIDLIREAVGKGRELPDPGPFREDLSRLLPDLVPDIVPGPVDFETARARLLEALVRTLEGLTGNAEGFGLCVDDLQWADPATLEVLTLLVSRGRSRVLGAVRRFEETPRFRTFLGGLQGAGQADAFDVPPLGEEDFRELLAGLIGNDDGPRSFSRWLHAGSGGNPMFALETLRSMFESGLLQSDRQGWHTALDSITRDYSELDAPAAIRDVVNRRTGRLSENGLRVLQAAAVMRDGFTTGLLSELTGLAEWAVIDSLEELEETGLLHGEGFRHDLLRQSVYRSLPAARRKALHGRAADVLAQQRPLIEIAQHYLAGGKPEEACQTWIAAAAELEGRGLLAEANEVVESALALVGERRLTLRLLATRARILRSAGEHVQAGELAQRLLEEATEDRVRVSALDTLASSLISEGKLDSARKAALEGKRLAAHIGDRKLLRALDVVLATEAVYAGRLDEARSIMEPMVDELRREGSPVELCAQLSSLAVIHDNQGRTQQAMELHMEALALAERLGARYQQVDITLNLVFTLIDLDRAEEAIELGLKALELGRYSGSDILRNNVARAFFALERWSEAREHYDILCRECSDPSLLTLAWARLAELHWKQGDSRQAHQALGQLLVTVDRTQVAVARATAAMALYQSPSPHHRQRAAHIEAELDGTALPPYIAEELRQARAAARNGRVTTA